MKTAKEYTDQFLKDVGIGSPENLRKLPSSQIGVTVGHLDTLIQSVIDDIQKK